MKKIICLLLICTSLSLKGQTIRTPTNLFASNISDEGFTLTWTRYGWTNPVYIDGKYYGRGDCNYGHEDIYSCYITGLTVNRTYKVQVSSMDPSHESLSIEYCFPFSFEPKESWGTESPLSEPIYVTIPAVEIIDSTDISSKGIVEDIAINRILLIPGFHYKPVNDNSYYRASIFNESSYLKGTGMHNESDLALELDSKFKLDETMDFNIYPNPGIGLFTIEQPSLRAILQVFNLNGQLLNTVQLEGTKAPLDISSLPSGIYTIKILNEYGLKQIRIIKE